MECLKSFNVRIGQKNIATNLNGAVSTWGTLGQYFFSLNHFPNASNSIYTLQGFKRTDLYGISVSGYVQGDWDNSTKCAVVEDWSFVLILDGISPLISGNIGGGANGFNIQTTSPNLNIMAVGKYTNSIMFSDPFTNVKEITFERLHAQGKGAQFLNEIALAYDLLFTFYYKYEGE